MDSFWVKAENIKPNTILTTNSRNHVPHPEAIRFPVDGSIWYIFWSILNPPQFGHCTWFAIYPPSIERADMQISESLKIFLAFYSNPILIIQLLAKTHEISDQQILLPAYTTRPGQ
jgi:hypothetical protein